MDKREALDFLYLYSCETWSLLFDLRERLGMPKDDLMWLSRRIAEARYALVRSFEPEQLLFDLEAD